jgi:hypothetical protein
MVQNLVGKLPQKSITRVDVNFTIEESNLDTFIGRKAHILFLDNPCFLKMMTHRYKETMLGVE